MQCYKIVIQILDSVYGLIYTTWTHITPQLSPHGHMNTSPYTLSRMCITYNILTVCYKFIHFLSYQIWALYYFKDSNSLITSLCIEYIGAFVTSNLWWFFFNKLNPQLIKFNTLTNDWIPLPLGFFIHSKSHYKRVKFSFCVSVYITYATNMFINFSELGAKRMVINRQRFGLLASYNVIVFCLHNCPVFWNLLILVYARLHVSLQFSHFTDFVK